MSRRRRTLAQAFMEWEPLVRIYESPLWRRSPLLALVTRLSFEREWALVAEAAELEGGERLLDLACGPGIYARRFARRLERGFVVGLDLSQPMLRDGTRRARREGLRNLALVRGTAQALPFATGAFGAVSCCGALHLFPDVPGALAEMQRVLAPGGRVVIAAVRRGERPLARWRAGVRKRLYGVDAFTPSDLASLLEGAGFASPRLLHAAGVWLVVRAHKPRVPAGAPA
jgi:SAM-dependent methyltransferase